jgi:hypothetical protein
MVGEAEEGGPAWVSTRWSRGHGGLTLTDGRRLDRQEPSRGGNGWATCAYVAGAETMEVGVTDEWAQAPQ